MTITELIQQLQALPGDAVVKISISDRVADAVAVERVEDWPDRRYSLGGYVLLSD